MKPGYKTTEYWLTIAAFLIGALIASGVLADGGQTFKIVSFIGAALSALGYTASRGFVKAAEAKALPAKKK